MSAHRDTVHIVVDQPPQGASPSLSIHLTVPLAAVRLRSTQLGVRVGVAGWLRAGRVGGPGLPSHTFRVALPAGMTVGPAGAAARVVGQLALTPAAAAIAPLRPPVRDVPDRTRAPLPAVQPLDERYREAQQAPRPLARLAGVEHIGPTAVAVVEVNPVFAAPDGRLQLVTGMHVSLPLVRVAAAAEAGDATPALASAAQRDRMQRLARAAVVNPADVPGPAPMTRSLPAHWDYVIVTDDVRWTAASKTPGGAVPGMTAAFQALADWKTSIGMKARVVKVSEIVASRAGSGLGEDFCSTAVDLQQAIRRFLRFAHLRWGTAYVLLAGDASIVPIRSMQIGSGSHPSLPSDLYYAALHPMNEEWLQDAKPSYGSYGFERLMPWLSVGRAPASTAAEALTFVAKVKRYEALRHTGNDLALPWLERILYVSTKWGGDVPTEVAQSAAFPPEVDRFAADPARARTLVRLADSFRVAQDANRGSTSPGEGFFSQPTGKPYFKLHVRPTYRNPREIDCISAAGTRKALAHNERAGAGAPGWFYTDWTDNDGPCHDAGGQNYPTAWIILYPPAGMTVQSFEVKLQAALRVDYNLLSKQGPGDYRPIAHDPHADTAGRGWCFAVGPASAAASPLDPLGRQIPTSWIAVYGSAAERAPQLFVLDPTEEADTMGEQEDLRRQVRRDIPCWHAESALYSDAVDVPAADRAGIDIQYYTREKLRAKLNEGQHVVSLAGHGSPDATCWGGEGGQLDKALASQLVNGASSGILYANSCLTNRFTEDNLSRQLLLKNAAGGVTAYVGFVDEVSIGLGHQVEDKFFRDLAQTGVLGIAMDARAGMVVPGSGFDIHSQDLRYTTFIMALLGDPALKVHGADREYLVASGLAVARDSAGALNVLWTRPDHRIAQVKQQPGGWARARLVDRGSWSAQMALGTNGDGRLECFYIGSDHRVHHTWQLSPAGEWSPSVPLDPGSYARQLAVASNADRRLEVFYIGSDDKLYHAWQTRPNDGWTGSFVLDNGSYARSLAVAPNQDGRLEVFYIGSDHKLYHVWQATPNGTWTGSHVLDNGSYAKQLAVGRNADRRLEVVYIGSDDKLYHLWQTTPNGTWTGTQVLDNGSYARQLAVAANQDGRLEVIYTGSDHKLYHLWQATPNSGWTGTHVLDNGSYAKQLVVERNADGRLEVIYTGSDDRIYHLWQQSPNGGWSASTLLKG